MIKVKLIEKSFPKKIIIQFSYLPDISDFSSSVKAKIVQVKDITNRQKIIIINFDLEGRIINIKLGNKLLNSEVKILERIFDGRFYIYAENCKNLIPGKKDINRYYDYYNEAVSEDLKNSKILIDSVNTFLKEIIKARFISDDKIEFIYKSKRDMGSLNEVINKAYKKYDWNGLVKERKIIGKIYSNSINVLPPEVRPDQNPVFSIIQIVQGCWIKSTRGPCGLCDSYLNVDYKEKNVKELKKHILQVKKNAGNGWKYVKKIFLLDADPFHTKIKSEAYLSVLKTEIPNKNWYESFISTPTILSKTPNEWKKIANMGLKKVYWGVESADNNTLKILEKPHNEKLLYKASEILKQANLQYVAIVLSGINNFDHNNLHIKQTVNFLNSINCSNIYISKFLPQPNTKIFNLIKNNRLRFPEQPEREMEHREMIRLLNYGDKETPKIMVNRTIRGTYGVQFNL